ncbi:MAG: methyltransferase domain-containing protein [Deltaproteobacteria bacterium]|nr:methyltransferase domain-containing protein [Deltaproteobacteria bacterium]
MNVEAREALTGVHDERAETIERLGPYLFSQKKSGHRLTGDSVSLVDFIPPLPPGGDGPVIDLGTGSGAILLLIARKMAARRIVGVEIDRDMAAVAKRNVEANGLASRITIVLRDWRELMDIYPEGSFSAVVSNPPYLKAGTGRISPVKERAKARSEAFGGLAALIKVSAHLAGAAGGIFYVFPCSRYDEMSLELKKAGLEAGRVRIVHAVPERPPKVFLIEARRRKLSL